jgi:hypothetical protein
MTAGAPTKFTPETRKRLLEARALGASERHCCDCAMISVSTLSDWKKTAESHRNAGTVTEYTEFFDEMARVYAQNGIEIINRIRAASQQEKHWTAGAWLLERQYRQDYGRSELPPEQSDNANNLSAEERLKRVTEILNGGANNGTG